MTMMDNRKIFRVTLSSQDLQEFLAQCEASEWYACDTGERIMTEEGPDAEAVLLVEPALHGSSSMPTALMH